MENKLWRYISWILIISLFISIGYGLGYTEGVIKGAEWTVRIGMDFVDIDFNEDAMVKLVNLYQRYCKQHQTAECLDKLRIG